MLHNATLDGDPGFCQAVLPSVLPNEYHGPLVLALDSNILIDLQEHGDFIFNGDEPIGVDTCYADELNAFGAILDLWLLRGIRFIVTASSLTDARRVSQRFLDSRRCAVEAIAQSLAYQWGDWSYVAPSSQSLSSVRTEQGLPQGADRDLILEAQAVGAHVFLTRDQLVHERVYVTGPSIAVVPPTWPADELLAAGVDTLGEGTCGTSDCPYASSMPANDIGKWAGLLSVLGGS